MRIKIAARGCARIGGVHPSPGALWAARPDQIGSLTPSPACAPRGPREGVAHCPTAGVPDQARGADRHPGRPFPRADARGRGRPRRGDGGRRRCALRRDAQRRLSRESAARPGPAADPRLRGPGPLRRQAHRLGLALARREPSRPRGRVRPDPESPREGRRPRLAGLPARRKPRRGGRGRQPDRRRVPPRSRRSRIIRRPSGRSAKGTMPRSPPACAPPGRMSCSSASAARSRRSGCPFTARNWACRS